MNVLLNLLKRSSWFLSLFWPVHPPCGFWGDCSKLSFWSCFAHLWCFSHEGKHSDVCTGSWRPHSLWDLPEACSSSSFTTPHTVYLCILCHLFFLSISSRRMSSPFTFWKWCEWEIPSSSWGDWDDLCPVGDVAANALNTHCTSQLFTTVFFSSFSSSPTVSIPRAGITFNFFNIFIFAGQ